MERENINMDIIMNALRNIVMDGRSVSHSGIISNLGHSHVEVLQPLMMLDIPVRGIRSVNMKLNACLEDLHGLLPVEVVVALTRAATHPLKL